MDEYFFSSLESEVFTLGGSEYFVPGEKTKEAKHCYSHSDSYLKFNYHTGQMYIGE